MELYQSYSSKKYWSLVAQDGKKIKAWASDKRKFVDPAAYVIDVGGLLTPEYLTSAVRKMIDENPGEVAAIVSEGYTGESCIIDPQGRVIAGPLEGEEILIADCCEEQIFLAKAVCVTWPGIIPARMSSNCVPIVPRIAAWWRYKSKIPRIN